MRYALHALSYLALVMAAGFSAAATPQWVTRPAPRCSAAVKRVLQDPRFAPLLADDMAPTARELRAWQREKRIRAGKSAIWLDAKAVDQVLAIFEKTNEPGHTIVVGNGMYQPYLMANALFAKTSMADRVHFLPMSKGLQARVLRTGVLNRYFDHLRLNEMDDNIFLVDSVATGCTLRAVMQSVRRYLAAQGDPVDSLRRRVIAMGIIEMGGQKRGMVHSLKKYRSSLEKIDTQKLLGHTIVPAQPFVSLPWGSFFNQSYGLQRGHYWGSKYDQVDERGFPVSGGGVRDAVSEKEIFSLLRLRKRRARGYLGLLAETAKLVDSDDQLRQRVQALAPVGGSWR